MHFSENFTIGRTQLGRGCPPFIVAELSTNHNGELSRALKLVDAAAACGASAIKLQTYRADTITLDSDRPEFKIAKGAADRKGLTLYQLYEEAHTPWEWHEPLFARAAEHRLEAFSSPFDYTAIDFLEDLRVPAYKIASFELVDLPLIRAVCKTGKPVIMSTGTAGIAVIREAIETCRKIGNKNILLLHCVSGYPTPIEESNLLTIRSLAEEFQCQIGLSDHTLSVETSIGAVALGAVFIEKHFTLDRAAEGFDASFSLEPDEMKQLVDQAKCIWSALGTPGFNLKPSEQYTARLNRSLYVAEDIVAGQSLTAQNIRSVRPNNGLAPKHYDEVLTMVAKEDISKHTPLSWSLIEKTDEFDV